MHLYTQSGSPNGQRVNVPVLALDDDRSLSESVAICRYLESLEPTPNLFGKTGEEAVADLNLAITLGFAKRTGQDFFDLEHLATFHERVTARPAFKE